MMAPAFNPSTQVAESGGFLRLRQAGLQSEFQDSQGYTEKPCLEKPKKKKKWMPAGEVLDGEVRWDNFLR
jgi:hypothetical protein